jgi:hypothetical protein
MLLVARYICRYTRGAFNAWRLTVLDRRRVGFVPRGRGKGSGLHAGRSLPSPSPSFLPLPLLPPPLIFLPNLDDIPTPHSVELLPMPSPPPPSLPPSLL